MNSDPSFDGHDSDSSHRAFEAMQVEQRLQRLAPEPLGFDAQTILPSPLAASRGSSSPPWGTIAVSAACGAIAGALLMMLLQQSPAESNSSDLRTNVVSDEAPNDLTPSSADANPLVADVTPPSPSPSTPAGMPSPSTNNTEEMLDLRHAVWSSPLTAGQLRQPLTQTNFAPSTALDAETNRSNAGHVPSSQKPKVLDSRQMLRELGALPPL